jgi:hypothetical protein
MQSVLVAVERDGLGFGNPSDENRDLTDRGAAFSFGVATKYVA